MGLSIGASERESWSMEKTVAQRTVFANARLFDLIAPGDDLLTVVQSGRFVKDEL
jgi:hypothetical protein